MTTFTEQDKTGLTFKCSLEGFKHVVADFCKAAATETDEEALEAGFKCVGLHWIGIEFKSPAEEVIAQSFLEYVSRRHGEAQLRIMGA